MYEEQGRGQGRGGGREDREGTPGGMGGGHYGATPREGGRTPREGGREGRRGTPLADLDPALTEVSRKLIGCAIEVHKTLGPGFAEDIYLRALQAELEALGVAFKAGHKVPVMYRGQQIGERAADMLIDNRFIVELMAERSEIGGFERASLRALLRAADLELGLIINFAERRLKDGLVRVLNPDKLNAMRGESGEGVEGGAAHHDDDDIGFDDGAH